MCCKIRGDRKSSKVFGFLGELNKARLNHLSNAVRPYLNRHIKSYGIYID